jgi:hypothetical protein
VPCIQDIPLGHKVALKDMAQGDTVIKYGIDIGKVVAPIARGAHATCTTSRRSAGDRVRPVQLGETVMNERLRWAVRISVILLAFTVTGPQVAQAAPSKTYSSGEDDRRPLDFRPLGDAREER